MPLPLYSWFLLTISVSFTLFFPVCNIDAVSLWLLSRCFSSSLLFSCLIEYDVSWCTFLWVYPIGIRSDSWICRFMFISLETFSATISSYSFLGPFSSFWDYDTNVGSFVIVSNISSRLYAFFFPSVYFLSVAQTGEFLLFYLQVHFPLSAPFCCWAHLLSFLFQLLYF